MCYRRRSKYNCTTPGEMINNLVRCRQGTSYTKSITLKVILSRTGNQWSRQSWPNFEDFGGVKYRWSLYSKVEHSHNQAQICSCDIYYRLWRPGEEAIMALFNLNLGNGDSRSTNGFLILWKWCFLMHQHDNRVGRSYSFLVKVGSGYVPLFLLVTAQNIVTNLDWIG